MGSEIFVMAIIFGSIYGVFYLHYSTRNKERMALIEKGADASIFARGKSYTAPIWKIMVLNIALLLMGIGAGVVIGGVLYKNFNIDADIAMPGSIFLMAGLGLLVGFFLSKDLDRE